MLDFSFDNILHSNLLNFVVMVAILGLIIHKLNVKKMLEDQRNKIEDSVNGSVDTKNAAYSSLEKAKAEEANLENEINSINKPSRLIPRRSQSFWEGRLSSSAYA